jgi:hypothetical protein
MAKLRVTLAGVSFAHLPPWSSSSVQSVGLCQVFENKRHYIRNEKVLKPAAHCGDRFFSEGAYAKRRE